MLKIYVQYVRSGKLNRKTVPGNNTELSPFLYYLIDTITILLITHRYWFSSKQYEYIEAINFNIGKSELHLRERHETYNLEFSDIR